MLLHRQLLNRSGSVLRRIPATRWQSSGAVPLLIDGHAVRPGQPFEIKHPRTQEVVSKIHGASSGEIDRAIAGAKEGFHVWSQMPASKRRDVLLKAAALIEERYDDVLAPAYKKDTSVANLVFGTDKAYSAEHMRSAATIATEIKGDIPPTMDGSLALVTREPYGVTLAMSPFNFGITLGVRAFCYSLAVGNSILWKANPQIPTIHYELSKIMHEAGVPPNAFQMLHFTPGTEQESLEQIVAHPDVRFINFTGSVEVGSKIAQVAGKHIKPILLELGGNAPAIVLESADLKLAANNIVFGGLLHSGHVCMSTARIVVLDSVADELVKELEQIVADNFSNLARLEMATKAGANKMHALVDDAVSKGATRLRGVATTPKDDMASYAPVILDGVNSSHDIYHQETVGPALVVIRVKDVEEAIKVANDSEVGLNASIWGRDYKQALDMAKRIECGSIHINSMTVHDEPNLPHGGVKKSGFGRFNGQEAGRQFTQTKVITLHDPHMLPIHALK